MKALLKVLGEMQHPFILSPTLTDFNDSDLLVVREFVPAGSLRDAIYGKPPKGTAISKYCQRPGIRKLSINDIKLYGRQVLEALNFLCERGFVMGESERREGGSEDRHFFFFVFCLQGKCMLVTC